MGYSVRDIDVKENLTKVDSGIWILKFYPHKDLDISSLIVHAMESIEDSTAHAKFDGLLHEMLLG